MGEWYRLVVGSLVVWRVTHLVVSEDGPWQLSARLRRAAGDGFFGTLLDCFYCLSVWMAITPALLLGRTWLERLLLIPALSAAAIIIERSTAEAPLPNYLEDAEDGDGVLRKKSDASFDPDDHTGGGAQT
jgi:Protein of unknown function (DUF1360)